MNVGEGSDIKLICADSLSCGRERIKEDWGNIIRSKGKNMETSYSFCCRRRNTHITNLVCIPGEVKMVKTKARKKTKKINYSNLAS